MIYAVSDLHGIPLTDLKHLLETANFGDADTLFVLGDSIDRGKHGIDLLLWMMDQPNVFHLLGNHEAMLLSVYETLLAEITTDALEQLMSDKLGILSTMLVNGAQPTLGALRKLIRQNPEQAELLYEYLQDMPLFDIVETENRTFILVHAGLGNFAPRKKLSAYTPEELLWHRPEPGEQYDFGENVTVVFGHTPTSYYGLSGETVRTDSWWCIDNSDVGPILVRLDDGAEFRL